MKHLFIVNPVAGGKDNSDLIRKNAKLAFEKRASSSDSYEIYVTKAPMDATEKIKAEALSGEHIRVYACGGDGTFNECICGAAMHENVAVCPYPVGTGNDFCRMFGKEKELFHDLDAILDGTETPIDLIDCNGRYSANICSVGIDARIGTDVHKYSSIPIIGGATAYVISAIINVFKGIATSMSVYTDGYIHKGEFTLVCVCNGRYYGGGFNPSSSARPDDGMLDILIAKKVGIFTLFRLIGKYASGHSEELPQYIDKINGTEIEIEFENENVVNVDGEVMLAKKVKMSIAPKAAKLIIPKGLSFFEQ